MLSNSPQAAKSLDDLKPASVCIVGCGLIGVSFAMALRTAYPTMDLIGVDINLSHRSLADAKGVFNLIVPQLSAVPGVAQGERKFELGVLAVPPAVAKDLLLHVSESCDVVMDVCSIKRPLCESAEVLGLRDRFAPSHPMSGIASEGPKNADGELFRGNPWILLRSFPACQRVHSIVKATGANIVWLDDALTHDGAMAAVSHGIHVTSLSAMLAYNNARETLFPPDRIATLANVTGPGFRDITRLADSPSEFWIDTLLANRIAVIEQIERTESSLEAFKEALLREDGTMLRTLLDAAREARELWRREH